MRETKKLRDRRKQRENEIHNAAFYKGREEGRQAGIQEGIRLERAAREKDDRDARLRLLQLRAHTLEKLGHIMEGIARAINVCIDP